jgi:hypothetical protein
MLRRNLYRGTAGLLALLVALLVARSTTALLDALVAPVPVVVARSVIPPYRAITADMLEVAYLPRGAVARPVYADPVDVVGRLARIEILPGVPVCRECAVPAGELRYTADGQAVILGVTVDEAHVPADLIRPGQRVDVWQAGRLMGSDLRVVAIVCNRDGTLVVALETNQRAVPALLAASGQADAALTLSPLDRLPTPITPTPAATSTPSPTPSPSATVTPGVAVVRPGPAQGLNVRSGPGTAYPVLATLPAGSRLTPVGRDGDGQWVEVCCVAGDRYGWVLAELVDLAGDLPSLPVR